MSRTRAAARVAGVAVLALALVAVFRLHHPDTSRFPLPVPLPPDSPTTTTSSTAASRVPSPSPGQHEVRRPVANMTAEEREAFEKKFTEKIKPAVDKWCRIYAGHLPFQPEDVTVDKLRDCAFPDGPAPAYSFVINGTTLGVSDVRGKIYVDYLMSGAANELFRIPVNPEPPKPTSVSRDEILRLIKVDSGGKEFPPDQIAIRPTSASGAMNGGVSVDIGVGVNSDFMPLPKFGLVFDPQGKLACYVRGIDSPPPK